MITVDILGRDTFAGALRGGMGSVHSVGLATLRSTIGVAIRVSAVDSVGWTRRGFRSVRVRGGPGFRVA